MQEYYYDVERAIDFAFLQKKFILDFYSYLKGKEARGKDAKQFLQSSAAQNVQSLIEELDEYLSGANSEKDNNYKQLREAYGHLSKPDVRKIRNYLSSIITDAEKYTYDKRKGRRKKTETK